MGRGNAERYPLFDLIRVIAALLVIISHSFALAGEREPVVLTLGSFDWTLGHLGVIIFFVVSGYLVSMSWERDRHARRFLLRRCLRIWPAFIVVILVTALVLGPVVTSHGHRAYLTDPGVWTYIAHNLIMSPAVRELPGVFGGNRYAIVNGSIWSLAYEVLCYLLLVVLGICRLTRPAIALGASALALALYRAGVTADLLGLPSELTRINAFYGVMVGVWFAGGMAVAQLRHLVVGRHAVGAAAVALTLAGGGLREALIVVPALAVLIIYVGTLRAPWAERVRSFGDPSYGMYLWAWPIQQLIIAARPAPVGPWLVMVTSAAGAIAAGYVSWHVIESPALRRVRRWTRPVAPAAAGMAPAAGSVPGPAPALATLAPAPDQAP